MSKYDDNFYPFFEKDSVTITCPYCGQKFIMWANIGMFKKDGVGIEFVVSSCGAGHFLKRENSKLYLFSMPAKDAILPKTYSPQ